MPTDPLQEPLTRRTSYLQRAVAAVAEAYLAREVELSTGPAGRLVVTGCSKTVLRRLRRLARRAGLAWAGNALARQAVALAAHEKRSEEFRSTLVTLREFSRGKPARGWTFMPRWAAEFAQAFSELRSEVDSLKSSLQIARDEAARAKAEVIRANGRLAYAMNVAANPLPTDTFKEGDRAQG